MKALPALAAVVVAFVAVRLLESAASRTTNAAGANGELMSIVCGTILALGSCFLWALLAPAEKH